MKKLFKNKKRIFWGIIIFLIIISIYFVIQEDPIKYNFSIAEKQDLIQEINATGRVKAVDEIDLAFENGGRINAVYVEVGDSVSQGQALVTLEPDDILAEIAQARAGVSSAEAKLIQYEAALEKEKSELEALLVGTRNEEILVYESKVKNAESVYTASLQNLINKIEEAYTKSDDSIRNKIDSMFDSPRGLNPEIVFPINNSQLENDIVSGRSLIEQLLIAWRASLLSSLETEVLVERTSEAEGKLNQVKSFLEDIALAANSLYANAEFSQAIIDEYKSDVYIARNNIATAITDLSSAKKQFNTADTSLLIAENELSLKKASSTPEKINSQKALIKQAEANVISQEAEIDLKKSLVQTSLVKFAKNTLKSPFDGIITKQDGKIGAIVSGSEIVVSVISENDLEIESNIVEADIAYLKIGDRAKLSLDAYGEDFIFEAKVIKIDPSAQLIEGVANYKTTLEFIEEDEKIRAGMTADLDIITAELKDVLVIPYRAIIFKNGAGKFVRVLDENNQINEMLVEIGTIGNGSFVQIIDGINEGDRVVTSVKKDK